jgi:hypothetical protein
MTSDVVKSISVTNLVSQRAGVLQRLDQAIDLLLEAQQLAAQAGTGFPSIGVCHTYASRVECRITGEGAREDAREIIRKSVDAGAWQHLMMESGLRTFMDATARAGWDESIAKGDVPELTLDTIRDTFGQLYEQRGDLFERGVIALFRSLSWSYKSNSPVKFGKRVVVRNLVNCYGPDGFSINHLAADELDDLVRVMHVLDGKPEPDHRDGMYRQLGRAAPMRDGTPFPRQARTEYLDVRLFRNGNGHAYFLRPELVDRMNLILAKHYPGALPEPK